MLMEDRLATLRMSDMAVVREQLYSVVVTVPDDTRDG